MRNLGLGVSDLASQFGHSEARRILRSRAINYAKDVGELSGKQFHVASDDAPDWIDLRTDGVLGRDYQDGTIACKFYPKGSVPDDEAIIADLSALLSAQYKLTSPAASKTRTWLIALGNNAEYWEELYRNGLIAIGWDDLGPLDEFETQAEIEQQMVTLFSLESRPSNDARACFDFVHTMREGDFIYVKRGRSILVGQGVVTGPYAWDENRPAFLRTLARSDGRQGENGPFPRD